MLSSPPLPYTSCDLFPLLGTDTELTCTAGRAIVGSRAFKLYIPSLGAAESALTAVTVDTVTPTMNPT